MALIGGVGHEINNPLTIILGFLDLELLKAQIPEESKDRLSIMRGEVLKIEAITNKLVRLAYSVQLPKTTIDINHLIQQVVEEARQLYPMTFSLELEDDLPLISFVPIQISSIFWQLIQNAHEAFETEENNQRHIKIKSFTKKNWLFCQIQDNGPGVSPELRDNIFKPFVTTQANSVEKGIGLNLCYEWLKHHKAKIHILKNNEKGSLFQLEFPIKT